MVYIHPYLNYNKSYNNNKKKKKSKEYDKKLGDHSNAIQ